MIRTNLNNVGIATLVGVLAMLVFGLSACSRAEKSEFVTLPMEGWRSYSSASFTIDSIANDGNYELFLLLRCDVEKASFHQIALEVQQSWCGKQIVKDTLACVLGADHESDMHQGVAFDNYRLSIGEIQLSQGDSARVEVRHLMRRSPLKGIRDVGIELVKLN